MICKKLAGILSFVFLYGASMGLGTLPAQSFDLSWYTIDGGGGFSSGGALELEGSIAQPDAGEMGGGVFELTGGYVGGTVEQAPLETVPDSWSALRGVLASGELSDVFQSDDTYLKYTSGIVPIPDEPPVWLIFDGTLPSDNPGSASVTLEASVNTSGLTQTIEMYNWNSNSYEEVSVQNASVNSDSIATIDVSDSIADFVQAGSGAVRTRIGWRQTGISFALPWVVGVDQVIWTSQ